MKVEKFTNCRSCGSGLDENPVISLGNHYVVDFVPKHDLEGAKKQSQVPLNALFCDECTLLQLQYSVDADRLYRQFWYKSGVNEKMVQDLWDIVIGLQGYVNLEPEDIVLDIGGNDGTMLTHYPKDIVTCNIDPAQNLEEDMKNNSHFYAVDYFNFEVGKRLLDLAGKSKYKVITAIAMFYDINKPNEFLQDVHNLLDDDGVFVLQLNHLLSMVKDNTFDDICHEHMCYYSLNALGVLLNRNGFYVADVELNDVNGGSIRVYCKPRKTHVQMPRSVESVLQMESYYKLLSYVGLSGFNDNINEVCENITSKLKYYLDNKKKIYIYGASTRGTTLLQTLKAPSEWFVAAAERNPAKYGLHMVGTWTPIVDEETARKDADVFFVLPYHFWSSIKKREAEFINKGGEMLIPLPSTFSYKRLINEEITD